MLSMMKTVHTETLKAIGVMLARCCDPDATPYQNVKENTFYPGPKRVKKDKVWWEDLRRLQPGDLQQR